MHLKMFDPGGKDFLDLIDLILQFCDLFGQFIVIKHMEGHSFIVLLDLKLLDMAVTAIDVLDKLLVQQFLVILVKLLLHELLGEGEGDIFEHYAEICSSYGVVVDHSFVLYLEVVYDEEADHPDQNYSY